MSSSHKTGQRSRPIFHQEQTSNPSSSSLSPALQHLLFKAGISSDTTVSNLSLQHINFKDEYQEPMCECLQIVKDIRIVGSFIQFKEPARSRELCSLVKMNCMDPSYYEYCVRCLSPIFKQTQELLASLDGEEFIQQYLHIFQWTKKPDLFYEVHKLLAQKDVSYDLLALLTLCAGLERSLGNLFLLKGSQVPAMLKDLLTTSELFEILGFSPLLILQVLIGPPISMNLRNVAWHGFFGKDELPRRYIYFLLHLTASIGKHLEIKGISLISTVFRSHVSLNAVDKIAACFMEFSDQDLMCAEQAVCKSWIVDSNNKTFFKTAFDLLKSENYGSCSVLLFPLLEHALRKLFVAVNDCPSRLITAETTALFTTFEEILDSSLHNGQENKVASSLSEPCMDLLHDLLVYPSGPRARDKLSHGEADYNSVSRSLPKIIIIILAWLAGEGLEEDEFAGKLTKCMSSYNSIFHPVALLKEKVVDLANQNLELLAQVTLSPTLEPWKLTDELGVFTKDNSALNKSMAMMSKFTTVVKIKTLEGLVNIKDSFGTPFSDTREIVKSALSTMKIRTLYRWRKDGMQNQKNGSADHTSTANDSEHEDQFRRPVSAQSSGSVGESEVVGLLTRIMDEASISVFQTSEALKLRCKQLAEKQLRSRQRDNLKRLLLFAPCAGLLTSYVIYLTSWILSNLEDYSELNQEKRKALQKQLKSTLQVMENLRTYTAADKNKWTEAGDLLLSEVTSACAKCQKQAYFQSS